MGLGLASRIGRLEKRLDPALRFVDVACQFHLVAQGDDGRVFWTDRSTRIYGGKWDKRALEYVGEADCVLHLPCTAPQLEVVESRASITEFSGGRGVGKSYCGLLVACKQICDRPFVDGRIVSPTAELYRVQWDKFVPLLLATGWLLDGENGVKEGHHELWFWNGVVVQFRSAHKPDRLRSWGGGWILFDESQNIKTKAVEIGFYCLREGGDDFQLYHQLTPEAGEALERHDQHVSVAAERPDECKVVHADSRQNILNGYVRGKPHKVSHKIYDIARRHQSRDQNAIEELGDWETVRRLAEEGALKPVFRCLVDEWKRYERGDAGDYPHVWRDEPDMWSDVTPIVVRSKLGVVPGFSWRWIAGVDPGTAVPNCCTVWRVFIKHHQAQPDWRAPRFLNLDSERQWLRKQRLYWVAWDFFEELGHCGHLGEAILDADGPNEKKAYAANTMVIVPDFTTWARTYQRQANGDGRAARGGGNFGQAAARLLQKSGFHVVKRPNPRVPASVQDVMEKIDPAVGEPRLLFRLPYAVRLFQNMATVLWDERGLDFDRSVPNDPTDSGRYPISMFDPAARIDSSGVQGVRLAS